MQALSPHARRPLEPRMITFGGGGGGVGRSTISRALAQQLAKRGRAVLLVDASFQGGVHHLHWAEQPVPSAHAQDLDSDDFDLQQAVVPGGRDKPSLLSLPFARGGVAFPPRIRAAQLMRLLRSGDWEDVLIDLDGRADTFNATMMALSEYPILVASTEASSLLQSVEILRQMIAYAFVLQPEADSIERRLLDALESLPPHYSIDALRDAFAHPSLRALLDHVLSTAAPWLLLNHTRDASERDLAHSIALGMGAITGVRPRILGAVGYDEERGNYLRNNALNEKLRGPGDAISTLAERLTHMQHLIETQPRLPMHLPQSPTDLIGIPKISSPQETRRAWRRLWDGLRRQSSFTQYILPEEAREYVLQQLEHANQELQQHHAEHRAKELQPAAIAPQQSAVARALGQARKAKGMTIQSLSRRAHIGLRYLEAIEAFEIPALPREVSLRGYLREIARALDLDPDELTHQYLSELHAARAKALDS